MDIYNPDIEPTEGMNNPYSANLADPNSSQLLKQLSDANQRVVAEIGKVIVGQRPTIRLLFAALLADGHVLIEGVPGIAKTMLAKLLARCLQADFKRIQFTPDLMPSDVVGTTVYNSSTAQFSFRKGPAFTNFLLIDEINRSPAKTQAALFEVMEERQITADGTRHSLEQPFMVLATQNPIEQEGTYHLPEAQLDRFLFRVKMDYPSLEDEIEILQRFHNDFKQLQQFEIAQVLTTEALLQCRGIVERIHIEPQLLGYIAGIVQQSRTNPRIYLGASPRASMNILKASKAFAAMAGRDFVTPDDIQESVFPVLNHRIQLSPETELQGSTPEEVINEMLQQLETPR